MKKEGLSDGLNKNQEKMKKISAFSFCKTISLWFLVVGWRKGLSEGLKRKQISALSVAPSVDSWGERKGWSEGLKKSEK